MNNNSTDKETLVYVPCTYDKATHFVTIDNDNTIQAVKPVPLSVLVWDEVRKMAYSTGEIDWTELRNFMLNDKPTK
jgi:hypothetical protein